jgi:hypothetical protein
VALGPFDVPAYGYIRAIWLLVTGTGGALGGGALAADFPFNVIQEASLVDTNGYPLTFPLTGYQLYLANIFGAYRGFNDVTVHPDFVGNAINMAFAVRLPVEITSWDTFGSLANQNPTSPFRVRLSGATLASIVVGGAPTAPAVRIRGYLEAWSPVGPTDMLNQAQQQAPPGHGATQYWSVTTPLVSAGVNQVRLTRVGNLIRTLIFVHRTAAGARDAAVEPDEFSLTWDQRQVLVNRPNFLHRAAIRDAYGFSPPTGVLVLPFHDDQDGQGGNENRHLWLATNTATRLDYVGTFGAGQVEVITNDVAITQAGR